MGLTKQIAIESAEQRLAENERKLNEITSRLTEIYGVAPSKASQLTRDDLKRFSEIEPEDEAESTEECFDDDDDRSDYSDMWGDIREL